MAKTETQEYGKQVSKPTMSGRYKRVRVRMFFPDPFNLEEKDAREARTVQSSKEECDINYILKKAQRTGIFPSVDREPQYGDVSEFVDYQTSLEKVREAQELFAGLPARVRDRFQNDPAEFINFATDPRNGEELVSLGLATKNVTEGQLEGKNTVSKDQPPPKSKAKKEDPES